MESLARRMRFSSLIILGLLLGTFSKPAIAQLGLFISSGDGVRDITPYRFSANWDFGPIWRCDKPWALTFNWETSGAFWHGSHGPNDGNDRLHLVTTGPMFRWQRIENENFQPYLEGGVGLSWLSRSDIGGRELSIHFQFEDKLGIGFRFGKNGRYDIAYRLYHYSNASIERPNSGVNIQMINLGIWFS